MQIKDILVHLDASPQSRSRLRVGCDLARRLGAHLTGLCVVDIALPVGLISDPGGYAAASATAALIDQLRGEALAAVAPVEQAFNEALRRDGIEGEWRLVEGMAAETVTLHSRYADLTILGQASPEEEEPHAAEIIEEVLFGAGRPALIIPYAGEFERVGRTVLIGWDAGREATRALHDALPLIAQAEQATVLAVNPRRGIGGHGDLPAADIALHLARHGVKVTASHAVSDEVAPGDVLLNTAADMGADLLVIGGYGHSRLREMLVGGVTRTLLQRMTLPVMMSH
jgi:nucleotide-binding universal stress UspA family protein